MKIRNTAATLLILLAILGTACAEENTTKEGSPEKQPNVREQAKTTSSGHTKPQHSSPSPNAHNVVHNVQMEGEQAETHGAPEVQASSMYHSKHDSKLHRATSSVEPTQGVESQSQAVHGYVASNQSSGQYTPSAAVQQNQVNPGRVYGNSQTSQNPPGVVPNGQYNRSNNYGGLWSPSTTHSNWSHSGQHYWNNHYYRWYGGGWLIIDAGFNPFYYDAGYYPNASLIGAVQTSLANVGYYNGPLDGVPGPGTRNAIAHYQSDNNLNVTGHINRTLLQSLQIQPQ